MLNLRVARFVKFCKEVSMAALKRSDLRHSPTEAKTFRTWRINFVSRVLQIMTRQNATIANRSKNQPCLWHSPTGFHRVLGHEKGYFHQHGGNCEYPYECW